MAENACVMENNEVLESNTEKEIIEAEVNKDPETVEQEESEDIIDPNNQQIEHPLQNQKHPLQYSWSFWYLKGDRQKDWVDCLRKIADFDTVEDFWAIYNHNTPASALGWGSDYYLFKTGIQPMWEDPKNVNGGRWLASVDKNQRAIKLDEYWLELLMAVIGEQFEELGSFICGAAVNIRQKGDKVALWTCNADEQHELFNTRIGGIMKDKLGINSQQHQLQYVVHKDSSSKRGSTLRPALVA